MGFVEEGEVLKHTHETRRDIGIGKLFQVQSIMEETDLQEGKPIHQPQERSDEIA